MKRKYLMYFLILLFIIVLIPSDISGNYQKPHSLEELVNRSDLIIEGVVQNSESKWDEKRTTINTFITVSVEGCIKGSKLFDGNNVVLMLPGGIDKEEGIIISHTHESPSFGKEERVILMLKSLPGSEHYALAAKFGIMHDNKIRVENIDKEEFIQKIKKFIRLD
jgi:hypothetical protein